MTSRDSDDVPSQELQRRFETTPRGDDPYARAESDDLAVGIRASGGSAGVSYLLDASTSADPIRLQSILLALTMPPPIDDEEVWALLAGGLRSGDEGVAASAIDGLGGFAMEKLRNEVLTLGDDERPLVRAAVLRYRTKHDGTRARATLLEALTDPAAIVRETAVDALDDLGAIEALAAVAALRSDPDPDVRQAVDTYMHHHAAG